MIVVDLKTKVLPQSHRIYMVRPGAAYHLLTAFVENSAVAPDLADLTIPDGERPRDFKGIDDQIKRARILAQWVKTEETRNAATPPTLIDEYKDMETPARVAMYRNTADEILHGLPGGSLIYLPNPDFTQNAIFGELADAKSPRVVFNGKGHRANFTYLGRPLKNVKQIPMQKLPKEFYPPMKRRNWIHEFEGRETELMYRQYYGDFEIIGRKSVTEIEVTKSKVFAPDRRCCTTLTAQDSLCESMQLDGWHEQAITCPLPHDELVKLHCGAAQARVAVDLAGQGYELARAA